MESSKLSKSQQEAKAYIDAHHLEKQVGEMLNSLVQAKDPSPTIFMIKYLAGQCSPEELYENGVSVQGVLPQATPLIKFPTFPNSCTSLLKQYLTKDLWEKYSEKKTKHKGDLHSIIRVGVEHPDNPVGVHATDEEAYSVFEGLLLPIAEELHRWNSRLQHKGLLDPHGFDSAKLGPDSRFVQSVRVRVLRNFTGFPFAVILNPQERERIEQKAVQVLQETAEGQYIPLASESALSQYPNKSFHRNALLLSSQAYQDWPKSRGIYVAEQGKILVNVNSEDHLKIYSVAEGGDLKAPWARVVALASKLEGKTSFATDPHLGYLTTFPSYLGTAMKITFRLSIPNVQASEQLPELLSGQPVAYKTVADDVIELYNTKSLGINEVEIAQMMDRVIEGLVKREEELSMGNNSPDRMEVEFAEITDERELFLARKFWDRWIAGTLRK